MSLKDDEETVRKKQFRMSLLLTVVIAAVLVVSGSPTENQSNNDSGYGYGTMTLTVTAVQGDGVVYSTDYSGRNGYHKVTSIPGIMDVPVNMATGGEIPILNSTIPTPKPTTESTTESISEVIITPEIKKDNGILIVLPIIGIVLTTAFVLYRRNKKTKKILKL